MFKNYLIIAWRNIQRQKLFSLINIFGLSIGLTCFLFIAVYVYNELSFDRYAPNTKDIYRVQLSATGNGEIAVYPHVDNAVGQGMKDAFPEILSYTRFSSAMDFVQFDNKQFKEQKLAFADANFLDFFGVPLIDGNSKQALQEPNTVVISKNISQKYFGRDNPIGKSILIGVNKAIYKVTGVFDKIPDQSHFHFDVVMSMNTFKITHPTWSNVGTYTYLQLNPSTNPKSLESKFPQLVSKYVVPEILLDMGVSLAEAQKSVNTFVFSLQPLTDIHLRAQSKYELEPAGDIKNVYIFSALAIFIILLACVNFTNLSSARAVKRAREVGIRKVMGSMKKQLVIQFLSESLLFSFLAMIMSYLFIFFLLPYFNKLSTSNIEFSYFLNYKAILIVAVLSFVTGVLAGLYPAFVLSSFNTIKVLKGSSSNGSPKKGLRTSLVVFQFFVSTALIIATVIIYQQLQYMQNRKLGYDKEQVLYLPDARLLGANQTAFKQSLLEDSRVQSASISRSVPGGEFMNGTEVFPKSDKGNGTTIHMNIYNVDYDYLTTLGIKIKEGRNFSKDFQTDSASGIVINEAAVRDLGWTNETAVGKTIVRSGQKEYTVVGVVADFNYASLKQEVAPIMLMLGRNMGGLIVKIKTDAIQSFLESLKTKWNALSPQGPLEYVFLDEKFATLFAGEQHIKQIFTAFAVLAMIIACLGLFGLSAYIIEERTKEIGIRKVLGASVKQVLVLVSKEFLVMIVIAFLFSIPVTWWAMNKWLLDFAYRINIHAIAFAIGGLTVLAVAAVTISFQAIKAALSNPIKNLREE